MASIAGRSSRSAMAAARRIALACALLAASPAMGADTPGMQPLQDDELAAVRGADGIAFNLSGFSLTSSLTNPLGVTYLSPNGSSLTLSGIDLSRTDAADGGFADPYQLSLQTRAGLADFIELDFPLNAAGAERWSLTADFSHCGAASAGVCTGTNFLGGTLQASDLAMKGGGLSISTPSLAGTDGIAFGLGTALSIGSLAVYSRGRDAATGVIDTSDSLTFSGISLVDARTGGAWMLADITTHPGLFNAVTDSSGSYLHLQIGWPTAADAVPAATMNIAKVEFVTNGVSTNLGSSSIASMQINYLDVKFKTGQ